MTKEEILKQWAMPHTSPSFPQGPYRFINREYVIITYETEPEIIRNILPEPLEPVEQALVHYEWIRMPDSAGFGDYTESGIVLPCRFEGKEVNFIVQMYLDDLPPIVAGREIWGFPKEYAEPEMRTNKDTITCTLDYAGSRVATGTMTYKIKEADKTQLEAALGKTQINLKIIPDVDGTPAICQLVAYEMIETTIKGAWEGDARLHLIPHVNAPVADLPVKRIVGGKHFIADTTLPYGRVVHDYLKG